MVRVEEEEEEDSVPSETGEDVDILIGVILLEKKNMRPIPHQSHPSLLTTENLPKQENLYIVIVR